MVEMQANSYNIGKTLAIIVTYTILYKIVLLLQRTSICHAQHWPTTPKYKISEPTLHRLKFAAYSEVSH